MAGITKVMETKLIEVISELGNASKAQVRKDLKAPGAIQAFLDFAEDADNKDAMDSVKLDFIKLCQRKIAAA